MADCRDKIFSQRTAGRACDCSSNSCPAFLHNLIPLRPSTAPAAVQGHCFSSSPAKPNPSHRALSSYQPPPRQPTSAAQQQAPGTQADHPCLHQAPPLYHHTQHTTAARGDVFPVRRGALRPPALPYATHSRSFHNQWTPLPKHLAVATLINPTLPHAPCVKLLPLSQTPASPQRRSPVLDSPAPQPHRHHRHYPWPLHTPREVPTPTRYVEVLPLPKLSRPSPTLPSNARRCSTGCVPLRTGTSPLPYTVWHPRHTPHGSILTCMRPRS